MSTLVSPKVDDSVRTTATENATILQLRAELAAEKAAHQADMTHCRAENARLKARNTELLEYKRFVREVVAIDCKKLSDGAKLAWLRMPDVYNNAPERKDQPRVKPGHIRHGAEAETVCEPVPMFLGQIGKEIGHAEDAAGRAVQELQADGVLVKAKKRQPDGKTPMAIALVPEKLERPRNVEPPEGRERNHGGKRPKTCDECGSSNILEVRRWVCGDCGAPVKDFDPRPVNAVIEPAPDPEPGPEPVMLSGRAPYGPMLDIKNKGKGAFRPSPDPVAMPEKTREALARKIEASRKPDGYHEPTPDPKECSHPEHMRHTLRGGETVCGECNSSIDDFLERGA